MTFLTKKQNQLFLLLILFAFHLFLTFPGELSPDSQGQYAMAISGNYTNHHPFIMSWLWHHLDMIYKGPALMLIFHMTLLYSSLLFLWAALKNFSHRWIIFLIPFVRNIFILLIGLVSFQTFAQPLALPPSVFSDPTTVPSQNHVAAVGHFLEGNFDPHQLSSLGFNVPALLAHHEEIFAQGRPSSLFIHISYLPEVFDNAPWIWWKKFITKKIGTPIPLCKYLFLF